MKPTDLQEKEGQFSGLADRRQYDKQVLALNALTDLAKKFSNQPDFHDLVDTVVLTLAGQFSVTNAFAKLIQPGSASNPELIYATGRFKTEALLERLDFSDEHTRYFLANSEPQQVDRLALSGPSASLAFLLSECGVKLVAPLMHGNRLIGIFGLGEKVSRKPFESTEYDLLATFVNTITPLIVNAFLFHEISEVNDWYLQILDNVKQGVFVFDSDFLLKKVNVPGYKILKDFRHHLKHIESLSKVPLQILFPESIYPGWAAQLTKAGQGNEETFWEKMKAKQGDEERIYNVRVGAVAHEAEGARDLIITLDDVTVQEENEQRLFDLEKFAEKGMMASSISHELNNYLGMLLGGVELTQIALARGNHDKVNDTLEKIKTNIGKMERFTTGLMDYAKLNTKKKQGNLNTVVTDVLSFIAVQKRFKNITISTNLDNRLPDYEMDTDQMAQLLLNLFNNAADAIRESRPDGGRIVVRTYKDNECACLTVSDNGAGMKPEVRDQLFKFHLTTKPGGHGYGLVVCNKIIQNHQGRVTIDSEVGTGTTFTVCFPIPPIPES